MSRLDQKRKSDLAESRNYLEGSQESWELVWQGGDAVNYLDQGYFTGIMEAIKFDSFIDKYRKAAGRRSLECGCGLATVSLLLSERGFDVTMLDSSPEALRKVKTSLEANKRRGSLLMGDICALPVSDLAYDLVHSYGVLEHFAEIEKPIKEMLRVLKPGGVFFADIVPANQGFIHIMANLMNHAAIFAGALARLRMKEWWRFYKTIRREQYYVNRRPLSDYLAILEKCGLENIKSGGYGLFPDLVLPPYLQRKYNELIIRQRKLGIDFNRSGSGFSRQAGFGWWIYGMKVRQ